MRNDFHPFGKQVARYVDCFGEKTAGVRTKVEHEALEIIFIQFFQSGVEITAGGLDKFIDFDVADSRPDHEGSRDARTVDLIANDIDRELLGALSAAHFNLNGGSFGTFQPLRYFRRGHAVSVLAVDAYQHV